MSVGLVSYGLDGHRLEYVEFFASLIEELGGQSVCFRKWQDVVFREDSAFFLMIEEDLIGFSLCAVARSAFRRKTVGLLFRGREAASPKSMAQKIKSVILRSLRASRAISVVSIVPFSVAPEISRVASHSIYDPQLWDQNATLTVHASDISHDIVTAANGRKIVVALGRQDNDKGFGWFCELWRDEAIRENFLFACAGKISANLTEAADEFVHTGGYRVDRHIDRRELMSLYQAADYVWAAYPPSYDQASGIMGRAVQYNVPVIVRESSTSQRVLNELTAGYVPIQFGDQRENVSKLMHSQASLLKAGLGDQASSRSGVAQAKCSAVDVLRSVLAL